MDIVLKKIKKQRSTKGVALIIFLFIILILFVLFGALTYRVNVSNAISRNTYVLTEAEFVANSAVRHALTIVTNVGIGNFSSVQPPNDNSANFPTTLPATTYDLGVVSIPNNLNDILRNNANLNSLTNNFVNNNFSYRVCVWKYDPNNNPNIMRVKVFVFYKNRLVKSFIFSIES
ncbi:MAG: hypothetical protein N2485_06745 [bacterium]|nr:hypothetical protein [bacterium]